jgi:hypothetical protein
MGAHVIIDARTKKVRASLDAPGEGTTIFAVDLIGDSWEDFIYFSEQATRYEDDRDFPLRNRYVRAAIAALFSHCDGVVCELFTSLRTLRTFAPHLPKKPDFCSVKAKIGAVASFLERERGTRLPALSLEMKLLRDIVNHPSITKEATASGSKETLLYDGADVYGIATSDLTTTGGAIDRWLDAACAATAYERFRDTKRLCEDFIRELGEAPGPVRTF